MAFAGVTYNGPKPKHWIQKPCQNTDSNPDVVEELVSWQALVWVVKTLDGQVRVVQENGRGAFYKRK
jgi:hypothetical protein